MIENEHSNIPRQEIPWFPTIDEGLCTNCGVCVGFCANGVYTFDNVQTLVTAPYNCVVGCFGCESLCSPGAIRFPDMGEFMLKLAELRAKYAE